jgi:hypothetical protein
MQCLQDGHINSFRFLSDTVMVVASISKESSESLDLYELKGQTGRTSMVKVVALCLPDVGYPIISNPTIDNLPIKNGVARELEVICRGVKVSQACCRSASPCLRSERDSAALGLSMTPARTVSI